MWIGRCVRLPGIEPDGRQRGYSPAVTVPVGMPRAYNSAVVCCDGTWMAPSDVHVQAAGAWPRGHPPRLAAETGRRDREEPPQMRGSNSPRLESALASVFAPRLTTTEP